MTLSPSGARIQGDDYQHLFAWYHLLRALEPTSGVTGISIEASGAGNVDDVVVHRRGAPDEHYQVKYSVDASHPIDEDFWTKPATAKGTSALQKFWKSFQQLSRPGAPAHLGLFTNRAIDNNHPILPLRDGQKGYLGTRLREAKPGSAAGKARSAWAAHLGTTEEKLLELLDHLELLTDQGAWTLLMTSTADRMAAAGLRSDALAVEQGVAAIHGWVTEARREITRAELEAEIARRGLRGGESRATLMVNALDRMPWADAATVSLDWVHHFEGSNPRERVQLRDPAGWTGLLTRELEEAERTIRARGFRKVEVRGFMRLPVWFAVGATFADTRGFRLTCEQRGERWSTEEPPSRFEATVVIDEIGAGEDLAIGMSVARDLGADVRRYIATAELPVRRFIHLAAAPAPSNHALPDAAAARALAGQVRDLVADQVGAGATGARRVHLFLAMPGGAALLLGYVWNRMPATQIYEDLGPGRGYAPTFLIPG